MDEYFSNLFKSAKNIIFTQIEELPTPISLSNNDSKKTYILTHKYNSSHNTFLGYDSNKEKVHLKVFPCKSFEEIQKACEILNEIYEAYTENSLGKIQDKFVILDQGKWYFVIVTKTLNGINLFDFSEFLHNKCEMVCKDLSIAILLVLLDFIKHKKNSKEKFDCIYPNTVLICKNSGGLPFAKFKKENYSIIILPFSNKTLFGRSSRLSNLFRDSDNDLWGLGITIYSLLGNFPYSLLPTLHSLALDHLMNVVTLREQDPALETIFRLILSSSTQEVISHSYLRIWGGIYQKNWESIDICGVEEKEVLHSGLFFTDPVSRKLVIKKLLVLGKTHSEIYEYLVSRDLFGVFIDKCIKIDWTECPELLEPFYKFLKYKPKDHEFKGKLGELGILGLVNTTLELDPHNRGFLEFVQDFTYENTLTLLQILYDKGVVTRSIKIAKNSYHDKDFLSHSMSFYGQHSVKVIEQIFLSDLFSVIWIVQALIEIPYQFKIEKLAWLMKLLLTILKKNNYKDDVDLIKSTLNLLTELICLPNLLQTNHLKGKCSSHTDEEFLLSKNKFLINCMDCNVPICSSCHKSVHKSHTCYYMLHITPHFRCNCVEVHSMVPNKPEEFLLPRYKKKMTFVLSNGQNFVENGSNCIFSEKDLIITTSEPFEILDNESVLAYFEVKINKAGNYENIVIGMKGAEIYYYGMNGSITCKNVLVGKGPRFGSYDTIGIGVCRNFNVFIVYNGLLLNQFFKCEEELNVKMFIGMFGDLCEVEVRLNNFLFMSVKSGLELFIGESKKSLEEVFKLLINVLKKTNDPKMAELKSSFENLLTRCNRQDLLKKMKRRSLF